jgi:hypothetical protein
MTGGPEDYVPPVVPQYVITGGLAHPTRNTLRPETLLCLNPTGAASASATPEQRTLFRMCRQPLSLAEAAAHLTLPISVVRVLASAMVDDGVLSIRSVPIHTTPDHETMRRVLRGLRNL